MDRGAWQATVQGVAKSRTRQRLVTARVDYEVCVKISSAAAAAKSLQSCLTLCNPLDCSLPGFPVHGILQERILEWVAVPSFRDLPDPGTEPTSPVSPALADGFFTASATWEALS